MVQLGRKLQNKWNGIPQKEKGETACSQNTVMELIMRQRGREREKEKYRENITRGKEYNAMPVTLDILTIRMSEFIQL